MKNRSMAVIAVVLVFLIAAVSFAVIMTKERVSQPGKDVLVVGTNTPFPPFEIRNGPDVIGLDIDIARNIAKALGRKLIVKDFTEFDALLPALQAGDIDMAASAVTIRDDRDEVVDFSQPYYSASQGILMRKADRIAFSSPLDAEDFSSIKVAYQDGTTSQSWIEDNLFDRAKVADYVVFDDFSYALQLLRLRSIDAIILDLPVAESFAKSNPDLAVAGVIETGENYGFAVQQDDPKNILPTINKVLSEMKKGKGYQNLLEKWFGGGK